MLAFVAATAKPTRLSRLIERDGPTCVWCGRDHQERALALEHVCPRSRGGVSAEENLLVSCRACHRARNSQDATSFSRDRAQRGLTPRTGLLEETLEGLSRSPRRSHREYGQAETGQIASSAR